MEDIKKTIEEQIGKDKNNTGNDDISKPVKIVIVVFLIAILLMGALSAFVRYEKERKGNEVFYAFLYVVHDDIDSIGVDYEYNRQLFSEVKGKYNDCVNQVGYITEEMKNFSFEIEFLEMSNAAKRDDKISNHKQSLIDTIKKNEIPALYYDGRFIF